MASYIVGGNPASVPLSQQAYEIRVCPEGKMRSVVVLPAYLRLADTARVAFRSFGSLTPIPALP